MGKYEIRGSKGVLEVMEKFKRVYIRPEGFIESKSIQTSITISSPFIHNLKRFVEKNETTCLFGIATQPQIERYQLVLILHFAPSL